MNCSEKNTTNKMKYGKEKRQMLRWYTRKYPEGYLNKKEKALLLLGLLLACGGLGILLYDQVGFLLCALPVYLPVEDQCQNRKRLRREDQLRKQFGDFLFYVSNGFATGRDLPEILKEAEGDLSAMYDPKAPIMEAIHQMNDQIHAKGVSLMGTLEDFAKDNDLEEIRNFVQVYGIMRETGGDIRRAMNQCATLLGDKISTEEEIQLIIAQKKFEGRVITVMPLIILVFLRLSAPEYTAILYASPSGNLLMTVAFGITIYACYLIERITDIHV